jgi:hypothetical protein
VAAVADVLRAGPGWERKTGWKYSIICANIPDTGIAGCRAAIPYTRRITLPLATLDAYDVGGSTATKGAVSTWTHIPACLPNCSAG